MELTGRQVINREVIGMSLTGRVLIRRDHFKRCGEGVQRPINNGRDGCRGPLAMAGKGAEAH